MMDGEPIPIPIDDEVSEESVRRLLLLNGSLTFRDIQNEYRRLFGGRLLSGVEKRVIEKCIYWYQSLKIDQAEHLTDSSEAIKSSIADMKEKILIYTAYSKDYSIGPLCEYINARYAFSHGYLFRSFVAPYREMIEQLLPRTHCTWYKILMLRKLLDEFRENEKKLYFVWIDADAVVIDHNIRLEDMILKGKMRDLMISEDMNPGCLINAGVMIVRNSDWSRMLWQRVWDTHKYDNVTFYEQSALIGALKALREGLHIVKPFHSYLPNGPQDVKIFAHVAVFPHLDLNTNRGWKRPTSKKQRGRQTRKKGMKEVLAEVVSESELGEQGSGGDNYPKAISQILISHQEATLGGLDRFLVTGMHRHGKNESAWIGDFTHVFNSADFVGSELTAPDGSESYPNQSEDAVDAMTDSSSPIEDHNPPYNKFDTSCKNSIVLTPDEHASSTAATPTDEADWELPSELVLSGERARFIFHPAGLCDKLEAIRGMLALHGHEIPSEFDHLKGLTLYRGKLGSLPKDIGSVGL